MPISKAPTTITVPSLNIETLSVKIVGTAPLIFHKWSEKAKRQITDKQAKKAVGGREKRDPEQEYKDSYYYDKMGRIAFPATNIKQAVTDAVRNIPGSGLTMTLLRGAAFIVGDSDGLVSVDYESEEMREDMVRVGLGSADVRYRGQLKGWSMQLIIKYNADVLSASQVINLLRIAGFSCGLGEWRPQKNGDFGTFDLSISD